MKKLRFPQEISPLVSTDYLAEHINDPGIVIIDAREKPAYKKGHMPNAVNIPFSSWVTERNGLMLEMPDDDFLFNLMGQQGISGNSTAVVVNSADNIHALADAARVAVTLIYTGLDKVAILNGGYDKWARENRPVSKAVTKPASVIFKGKVNNKIFVSREYVKSKIGKSIIIDARAPEVYFGVVPHPFGMKFLFYDRAGHIPTAKSLPTPWIWDEDGTYRSLSVLRGMVAGIAGENKSREIIIYCGVGGNTAAWWYIMTRMLGYKNVKYFIGSSQEWTRHPDSPVVVNKWE